MRTRVLWTAGLVVLTVIPLVNLALAYWVLTNPKVNLRIKQWTVGLFSDGILIFNRTEKNLIYLRGSVPGARRSLVKIVRSTFGKSE